ncbi:MULTISPECIES: hypothetical protein [Streptomyces]|uniref:hypothetical protein n=1 Tax=Streptomyces TaxID=1883 RepID=UPI001990E298|nr:MULTISPECIES: hypothetical protein [Streptomyces]MCM3265847.1 hypothetical protein [Streptomyces thermoviolaceus]WTD48558.1 hypothetical protein OG899_14110 [Streptomyces thermoviolaceus]GGV83182.1 hypothetical protein GCM10010499_49900 [Streptomyces thermoviolaceus subsp. apingens]
MYDERIDRRPGYSPQHAYLGVHPGAPDGPAPGTGRHRAPTPFYPGPLVPPDSAWDPAEELAFMLQDAMEEQRRETNSAAGKDMPLTGIPDTSDAARSAYAGDADPLGEKRAATPLENLQEITAQLPPLRDVAHGHRKVRERRRPSRRPDRRPSGVRAVSHLIAALTAVTASAVSFFGGVVAYDPLRFVAVSRMEDGVASWWPLLVYGPWLVASLSVLRSALYRRRAVHSWGMVLLFSSIAMLLCVIQAPRTIVDISAAALPALASLACFQQLVRQITLTRPPRRTAPRHRLMRTRALEIPAQDPALASLRRPASPAATPAP